MLAIHEMTDHAFTTPMLSHAPVHADLEPSNNDFLQPFLHPLSRHVGLLVDMAAEDLERVLYFERFVVTEPGLTPLKLHQPLTEEGYLRAQDEFGGDAFVAQTGIEAVKHMLAALDLEEERTKVHAALAETDSETERKILAERLKLVEVFLARGAKPEWMILDVVPELWPVVPFDRDRPVTPDDDELYQRVAIRNARLKQLIELRAPEIILRNEKRMLRAAVNALLDNG